MWKFARDLNTIEQYQASGAVQAHGEKVFSAVNMAVNHLNDFDAMIPILIRLGYKHHSYGALEEHLPVSHLQSKRKCSSFFNLSVCFDYLIKIIGNALISTLADVIESDFTDEMRHTWKKLYKNIEVYMIIGMRQAGQMNEKQNPSVASLASQQTIDRKQSLTIYNTPLTPEPMIAAALSQTAQSSNASTKPEETESEPTEYTRSTPLTADDVNALRESWSRVREIGLSTFGTNMMIMLV